jgi:cell pole-organizing protein PopZ
MTAPNPTSGERDLEALRRAQRAHEPSMEEILASIRSIIADEREAPPAPRPAPAQSGPQIVYSNPTTPVAPASPIAAPFETPRQASAPVPTVVWDRAEAEPAEAGPERAPEEIGEPLTSPQTDESVAVSFGALSASVAMHNSEMIENLTREMLRPMLKSWLDDNLPSLVERLVRAEIQRVARGGR